MERVYDGELFDQLFQEVEEVSNNRVSRGDLIMIGGSTIREMMVDNYLSEGKDPREFEKYYLENVRSETKRLVETALAEGKYVEMFSAHSDGSISEEPEQLRFSDREAALPETEEQKKILDSRERVRIINFNGQLQMDVGANGFRQKELLGDWMKENNLTNSREFVDALGGNPLGLSVTRTGLLSLTVLSLFSKGYSMDEICNPGKIKEIKQQAGRELVTRLKSGEYDWLGETTIRGQKNLLDQMDEKLKRIDLSDERQLLDPQNRDLFYCAYCAYDAHQEKKHFEEALWAGAEKMNPENPQQIIDDFDNRAITLPSVFDAMRLSLNFRVSLSNGIPFFEEGVTELIQAEHIRRQYAQRANDKPDTSPSYLFSENENDLIQLMGYRDVIGRSGVARGLNHLLENPSWARVIGRELLSGSLQKSMDMTFNVESVTGTFEMSRAPLQIRDEVYKPKVKKILREETTKIHGNYASGIEASIRELDKADPPLLRSSQQYKGMQAQAKNMAEIIQNIGEPLTYQEIQHLHQASSALIQSVEAYKKYKDINHTGSKRELRRIAAADNLLQLGRQIAESVDRLNWTVEMDPQLRTQMAALENINTSAEKTSAEAALEEERAQQRAQREAVSKEVLGHMNRRYGKDAPSIYHAAGSMVKVKTANGEQKDVSVVEKLGHEIMKHKDIIGVYINGGASVDPKWQTHLRNTMARMVAMESIVMERIVNRYQPGQETVVPGPQEDAYAKDSSQYLKSIMKTDTFKKTMSEMNPEKMKDFILKDGAMELARSMQAEAVKKAQTAEKDAPEKQMQQKKQKEINL